MPLCGNLVAGQISLVIARVLCHFMGLEDDFFREDMMAKKWRNNRERFETLSLYVAGAIPVLGLAGGGYLGATAGFFGATAGGAAALGVACAAAGAALGVVVGITGFIAANAIYKNKEYIIAGSAMALYAPFALAGRGLKAVKDKLFGHSKKADKSVDTAATNAAVQRNETGLSDKSAQPDFKKSAQKAGAPTKQPKAAARKTKDKKHGR